VAEHPNEELRQRIETALKSRAADAEVCLRPETDDWYGRQDPFAVAMWNAVEFFASAATETDALRELAKAAGLAEIERLRAELAALRAAREDALDAAFNDGVNAMKALAIKACNVVSDTHGPDPKRQRWPAQVGALDTRATIKAWPVPKRGEPVVEEEES
jgi:hypothetical protein